MRQVLGPLGWDELLAVKAVLADPPPGRDLSPADLVALSRGAPPAPPPLPAPKAKASRKAERAHRGRPRAPHPARPRPGRALRPLPRRPAPARRASTASRDGPSSSGLVRRHGRQSPRHPRRPGEGAGPWTARRPRAADLRPPPRPPPARPRLRRAGTRALPPRGPQARRRDVRMARELGATPDEVRGAIDRLGIRPAIEVIREPAGARSTARRPSPSAPACIDEEADALADLGLLARFEEDLRRRMPQHLRALSVGGRSPRRSTWGEAFPCPGARWTGSPRASPSGPSRAAGAPRAGRSPRRPEALLRQGPSGLGTAIGGPSVHRAPALLPAPPRAAPRAPLGRAAVRFDPRSRAA